MGSRKTHGGRLPTVQARSRTSHEAPAEALHGSSPEPDTAAADDLDAARDTIHVALTDAELKRLIHPPVAP
jgi:hypothetical protein